MLTTLLTTLALAAGATEPGPIGPSVVLAAAIATEDGLPSKAPSEVGMSATRLQRIDRVFSAAIRAGGFPGGSVVVGRKGATVFEKGYGTLGWNNKTPVVASRTIYDLASL